MFIHMHLSWDGEDYMFAMNGLYSHMPKDKEAGEAYVSGDIVEGWVDVGSEYVPLADIRRKFAVDIRKLEMELLELEEERLKLRMVQVKSLMNE